MVGLCLLLSILGQAIWLPSINLQHSGHLGRVLRNLNGREADPFTCGPDAIG
jgi:hypothetical protein